MVHNLQKAWLDRKMAVLEKGNMLFHRVIRNEPLIRMNRLLYKLISCGPFATTSQRHEATRKAS